MMKRLIFNSVFKKEFQDLINLKQAQGFKYTSECSAFLRLDKFFYENGAEKLLMKLLVIRQEEYQS